MMDLIVKDNSIKPILGKALAGERISVDECVALFESDDYNAIGQAANEVKKRKLGDKVFYVVNRHINYTDICRNECRFCAYSRRVGDRSGYVMTSEEVLTRALAQYEDMKFTELHIVGGCHPELPLSYYTSMLNLLKSVLPEVHIQAFTAVEIMNIADVAGIPVKDALAELKNAGLDSIPGGGAEVFDTRIRAELCPEKLSGEGWLGVMREAHLLGIKSNSTMLYGHIETYAERAAHMAAIRELQDETGGFMTFIPLKFHPENTKLANIKTPPNSIEDLKIYSISRLMLDNIPHIKAFWIMQGLSLAQVSLSYGVDDFDGTVVEEKITHRAGAATPQGITVDQLIHLIEETGNRAVERDTVYNEVVRDEAGMPAISER